MYHKSNVTNGRCKIRSRPTLRTLIKDNSVWCGDQIRRRASDIEAAPATTLRLELHLSRARLRAPRLFAVVSA